MQERLARALGEAVGKQVEVKVVVDPTVLGGVMARVGDIVIDGTIRHRLEELKERIAS
jgi:F-type H+-transporting ATPase subunit delta